MKKICKGCGQEFDSAWQGKKYCSQSCYDSVRVLPDKVCEQCGKPLTRKQIYGRRKYCSFECSTIARSSGMVTKTCPVCGNEFSISAAIADRYTVCSRDCRTASTKYVTCKRCVKVFRAEQRLNRHYCSEECRRPPKEIPCDNCG